MEKVLSEPGYAKEVRLYGLTDYLLANARQLFDCQQDKLKKVLYKQLNRSTLCSFVSFLFISLCQILIIVAVLRKRITIGDWQFYTGSLQSAQHLLINIFSTITKSYEENLLTNVLNDFFSVKPEIDLNKGQSYTFFDSPPVIEFKGVSFAYPQSTKSVICNLNFKIAAGEKIALVGVNGAGKSTIIKLLTRLYEPTAGEILFNGINIKNFMPKELYQTFGVVFQDFARYGFSISDNIGISDIANIKNMEKIKEAAISSQAHQFITKMPKGYETCLTKEFDPAGFANLSGGEWQKIAIARSFFRNGQVVILDEPTASLDPEAEYDIYQQFVKLVQGRTAVIVSHRLSSVRMVDRILVIKNGTICEQGSHHQLMELNQEYARLFRMQAEQYFIPKTS